jgi:hypothetical protein
MVYPTVVGGREWYLSDRADIPDDEWLATGVSATSEAKVFYVSGSPRMDVLSPSGKAWWRNVEMTGYLRYLGPMVTDPTQRTHWEWYARGERHTRDLTANPAVINRGVRAPAGTATWPGYPFGGNSINARCLGTALHGNIYLDGEAHWEKEISHTDGYVAENRGLTRIAGFRDPLNRWFGFKVVIRNAGADRTVQMEAWVDPDADGTWTKVDEVQDAGGWTARDANINGCGLSPFAYGTAQIITWAGPYVTFRMDNGSCNFKWFSAREVAPLP